MFFRVLGFLCSFRGVLGLGFLFVLEGSPEKRIKGCFAYAAHKKDPFHKEP